MLERAFCAIVIIGGSVELIMLYISVGMEYITFFGCS